MKIIFFIIFIICAIITFKKEDKMMPNHPYLSWILCMIGIGLALYLVYCSINGILKNTDYNAGVRDALRSIK